MSKAKETEPAWIVELHGKPIARLSHPQFLDMFEMSYVVEPLSDKPTEIAWVKDPIFYIDYFFCLRYRYELNGKYTKKRPMTYFVGMKDGRLLFRGLDEVPS